MSDNNNKLPAIFPVSALNLNLPEPSDLVDPKAATRIKKAVSTHVVYTPEGELLINKNCLKTLLQTDQAGANLVVANLPPEQKMENGNDHYVKSAPINQELSRRIQEPRDAQQLQGLKYSEACLNTARDNPELEVRRLVLESRNEKAMPAVKKVVKQEATECLSGQPLQSNAEVHHKERVADQPRKSVDPNNMVAVNPEVHSTIHNAQAHSQAALEELAKQQGWPASPEGDPAKP